MKVKVIKDFRDKHTGTLHKVDEELNITQERFGDLTTGPLGVFVKEIKEEVQKPKSKSTKK